MTKKKISQTTKNTEDPIEKFNRMCDKIFEEDLRKNWFPEKK